MGEKRAVRWTCGGSGRTCSAPVPSVLITSLKSAARLDWCGMQPGSSSGGSVNASLMPSGLIAGRSPGAIEAGFPPLLLTDSISDLQPDLCAKYTVDPSGLTLTSSPTPPETSVAMMLPFAGSSFTRAPAVVTATMPGPAPVGGALLDETTTGALLAGRVTVAVGCGLAVPLPHAASRTRTGPRSRAGREAERAAADIGHLTRASRQEIGQPGIPG